MMKINDVLKKRTDGRWLSVAGMVVAVVSSLERGWGKRSQPPVEHE